MTAGRRSIYLILLSLLCLGLSAEEWCGVVRDAETGRGLALAQILLLRDGRTVVGQAITSEDGSYCIELPSGGGLSLRASLMGFRTEVVELKTLCGRSSHDIRLRPQDFKLPEVSVQARAVEHHGDTVTYRAGAFTQPMDSKLEDVLLRLPDVSISSDGMISYKGRGINRFYIEDLDLLGSRYSIATRNIRPEDVAAVQVYERHEPIRMLREQSRSDRAALNVRLKESAKRRWLADLGGSIGGLPLIGKVSGSLMNFRPRRQTIIVAKGDNTGDDIVFETRVQNVGMGVVFNPYRLSGGPESLFRDRRLYSTFFGRDRRRDNRTAFLSVNHLMALSEVSTIRLNLNGYHDRNRLREERSSHYYDPVVGTVDLLETTDYLSRRSATENELTYEYNGDRVYLKDILSVRYHHLTTDDRIAVGDRPQSVRMRLPSLSLSNSLTSKRLLHGHLYTTSLGLGYSRRPQQMVIRGVDPYSLLSDQMTGTIALDAGYTLGVHRLTPEIRLGVESYRLEGEGPDVTSFGTRSTDLSADLSLGYRLALGRLTFRLTPSLRALLRRRAESRERHLLPSLSSSLRYDWLWGDRTSLTYSFSTGVPDLADYFPHAIRVSLTDYREGIADCGVTRSQTALLRHEGSALWDLSYVLSGSLSRVEAPRIYTLSIRDDRRVGGYLPLSHTSHSEGLKGELSRYFAEPMITVKGDVGYTWSRGSSYQQGLQVPYRSGDLSYGASLHWMGSTLMTLEYALRGSQSEVRIGSPDADPLRMSRLEQTLKGTLLLGERWGLSASLQHYRDSSPRYEPVDRLFLDGTIYYTSGRVRLQADLTNLTNVREEYYQWTDGINSGSRRTALRGREILLTLTLRR